ncbi:MAG: hypothetical protein AAB618_02465 [Patescibacteria group bacterium]
MFRTRNLAIVAIFVFAGALGAAGALFETSIFGQNQLAALGLAVGDEEKTFSATLPKEEREFNYDERVSELREKIAGRVLENNDIESEVLAEATTTSEAVDADVSDDEAEVVLTEKRCNLYQPSGSLWDARGVKMQVQEGARTFYRNGTATASVGSTTTPTKEILAELPLRNNASGAYCIPSDVIGITENGFLIHNNEVDLFAAYGSSALIGYALDGFPIYGGSGIKVDQCGGVVVGGQYRYVLDIKRPTIIACYAGTPIAI